MDLHQSKQHIGLSARIHTLLTSGATVSLRGLGPRAIFAALRLLLNLYPSRFRESEPLRERILRAFVMTIIPGAEREEPDLVRMYSDPDYPFHPYAGFLVYDLVCRAGRLYGNTAFEELTDPQRTCVVENALESDDTTARLYRGAILMANVSFFAGIYHPDRGCSLIDFPGRNEGFSLVESSSPGAQAFFGREDTNDGNPP